MNSDWTGVQIMNSDWTGVQIMNSDGTGVQIMNSDWTGVQIMNSDWTGVQIMNSDWTGVQIMNSDCLCLDLVIECKQSFCFRFLKGIGLVFPLLDLFCLRSSGSKCNTSTINYCFVFVFF